ncbi:TerB family tellurite resistance protein [bacterium]|nr:TerB family tellurite resistance protein [bacterium]
MNVPINEFNEEQRLWYGYLVASATKADGAVDPSEIEFLIKALHFLDAKQKAAINKYLKTEKIHPGLAKIPKGISRRLLAIIFTELIWIIVSDGKLIKSEVNFIKTVSGWFGFSDEYYKKTLQWGEQMLKAEKYRRALVDHAK